MQPNSDSPPEIQPPPPAPVMDVVVAPPPERVIAAEAVNNAHDAKTKNPEAGKTANRPDKPKPPSSGVGMAILATVIIVLGLAALTTFAYLKQVNKI